ncbi:hypothetical protein TrispH2_003625 [Trichoplax sp. H2]|nr:hypothetical protein TrispH2_003625 [Trichoplax sp. H2]|eukprot:RDD45570.1 hypothetical protein TrispH2_003625 [Trichoplax sp. H2]
MRMAIIQTFDVVVISAQLSLAMAQYRVKILFRSTCPYSIQNASHANNMAVAEKVEHKKKKGNLLRHFLPFSHELFSLFREQYNVAQMKNPETESKHLSIPVDSLSFQFVTKFFQASVNCKKNQNFFWSISRITATIVSIR